ncbi:MAG: PH domain-containing protein [Microbacteriaceae bacterium]
MTSFVSRSGRVLAVLTVGVFGVALATTLTPFIAGDFVRALAVFAFLSVACYAAFWRPRLDIDDNGVTVRNPFSTHRIEWGAIDRIDTKWGLTLFVGERRISVWAAPAPGRHAAATATRDLGRHLPESTYLAGTVRPGDLASTESGGAAAIVRRHWERRDSASGQIGSIRSNRLIVAVAALGVAATVALSL